MDEDKKLYDMFLNGNNKSFENLILKYKNNLIYFICRYVKNIDVAEDIFQEVMLFILEKKDYYNFDYSFKTYIYMIAKSKALDYIKKEKRTESIEKLDFDFEDAKLLEDIILTKERQTKIQNVMKKMSVEYQLVIYLTQIEGLSYRETALILDKTENNIKALAFNARKKLKKLLIKEKVIEVKNNKIILIGLVFLLLAIPIATVAIIGARMLNDEGRVIIENSEDVLWSGAFQIAWNELAESYGGIIEFEESHPFVDKLNEKAFTKEMLSEDCFYVASGNTNIEFKNKIKRDIKYKFKRNDKSAIDKIDFSDNKGITIYSTFNKDFKFINKFDVFEEYEFGDSTEKVKYFGIKNVSDEKLNENIEVIYFDYTKSNYAVKLKTNTEDEVILYKGDTTKSFDELYSEVVTLGQSFEGEKTFGDHDQFIVPYIKLNAVINYSELCDKVISGTDGTFINNAFENINLDFNETGVNLYSETVVQATMMSSYMDTRYFMYDSEFILFLKEKNADKPYFALKIDDIDFLVRNL